LLVDSQSKLQNCLELERKFWPKLKVWSIIRITFFIVRISYCHAPLPSTFLSVFSFLTCLVELLSTGKLTQLEKQKRDPKGVCCVAFLFLSSSRIFCRLAFSVQIALETLTSVHGIGPKKALELYEKGIHTLEDLEQHKSLLNQVQKTGFLFSAFVVVPVLSWIVMFEWTPGLKYARDFQQKIPRSELAMIEQYLLEVASTVSDKILLTICGSYRRGLPQSGDVDVLLTSKDWKSLNASRPHYMDTFISKLEKDKFLVDFLARGPSKIMAVCRFNQSKRKREPGEDLDEKQPPRKKRKTNGTLHL
jgi:DNA polymerase/3'-5' exonuclease PolX